MFVRQQGRRKALEFLVFKSGDFEGGKTNKHNFLKTHRIINNRQFNKVPQTF